jgi:hypothetical protein
MKYRRLPGRRRGLIRGASVWLGEDHLLSVKSLRIREDYKRFYFRDIQASAVARAPRFHISTRSGLIGALWLIAYAFARLAPVFESILWVLAALLVIAWIVISARFSCRCRIQTAVSRDELPSLYRTWTAKKFLAKVEPRIAEVQGATPANWAEAAEAQTPPPVAPLPTAMPQPVLHPDAKVHTLVADVFVATLFLAAIADFLHLKTPEILTTVLLLAETIVIFVQYYRGQLRGPMQKLAIVNLIAVGIIYYAQQMVGSFRAGMQSGGAAFRMPTFYFGNDLTQNIGGAVCCVLGLVGLGIILQNRDR